MTTDKRAMLRELTAEEVSHVSGGLVLGPPIFIFPHPPINHPLPPTPIGHKPIIIGNPPRGPVFPGGPHFSVPV